MPYLFQEVSYWILGGPLEMPKVGDMNHSAPANENPCQGEMPKARSLSFSKKVMAVVVGLRMQM